MKNHSFLFKEGVWEGEGTISFSMAEDQLNYKALWTIEKMKKEAIRFIQEIEIESFQDKMVNQFTLYEIQEKGFVIDIKNPLWGVVTGSVIIDPERIAWEFRENPQGFEGYEIYEKKEENLYLMRAEFFGDEDLRTLIKGSLRFIQSKQVLKEV